MRIAVPVEIAEPAALKRFAKRPARTVLDCRLHQLVSNGSLPHWQQGVQDYVPYTKRES